MNFAAVRRRPRSGWRVPLRGQHLLGDGNAAASAVVFPTNLGTRCRVWWSGDVTCGLARRLAESNAATLVGGSMKRHALWRVGASRRRPPGARDAAGREAAASWRVVSLGERGEALGVSRTVRCVGRASWMRVRGGRGRRNRSRRWRSADRDALRRKRRGRRRRRRCRRRLGRWCWRARC